MELAGDFNFVLFGVVDAVHYVVIYDVSDDDLRNQVAETKIMGYSGFST